MIWSVFGCEWVFFGFSFKKSWDRCDLIEKCNENFPNYQYESLISMIWYFPKWSSAKTANKQSNLYIIMIIMIRIIIIITTWFIIRDYILFSLIKMQFLTQLSNQINQEEETISNSISNSISKRKFWSNNCSLFYNKCGHLNPFYSPRINSTKKGKNT